MKGKSGPISGVFPFVKKCGETPLQALERFRLADPRFADAALSYAGRLDPMAEGLLLVLAGEENKQREKYLGAKKTYEVKAILGVTTDTYDILGKIISLTDAGKVVSEVNIKSALMSFVGEYLQPFPPYSSKPVQGKPLFVWAREGKLGSITIPTKNVTVHGIEYTGIKTVSAAELDKAISEKISLVSGDFRQDEIRALWDENLHDARHKFQIISFSVEASSGFYVRSLVHELGTKIGTGATVLSILRSRLGDVVLGR